MNVVAESRPQADESWDHHYRDERDAAYLYRALASVEKTAHLSDLFGKLAVVEDRHVQRWEELFRSSGRPLPAYKTAGRTRMLAWAARRFVLCHPPAGALPSAAQSVVQVLLESQSANPA